MEPNCDSIFAPAIPIEVHGIKILKQPSDAKLAELGVASWPIWESTPQKFPWKFKKTETMYFLEGKVKVTIDEKPEEPALNKCHMGYDTDHEEHKEEEEEEEEKALELMAGDLVVIPKDMKVVVEVTEAVRKHYFRESRDCEI